ncbi:hypothetical protein [Ruficoccus sp. ZRK36]|uniref:hypothetical protein n=1 Tax=Ruficoccus sp. ZRK36 TaxID=2866311 RepID=UPI001C737D28|nr:hypothetical protein [Ruficoccus sp. ZRK36]QYY36760.1 hypothetical protein K0V07_04610 [Ruficoccus sp. ZRK36]
MKNVFSLSLAAAALFVAASAANAAVLVHYTDNSTQTPINSEYTINPVTPHAPFAYSGSETWWTRANGEGLSVNPTGTAAEKETATIAANSYVEFGLNAVEGYQIDIDSVSFYVTAQSPVSGTGPTAAMTVTVFLRSSLDDYTDTLVSTSIEIPARPDEGDFVSDNITATANELSTAYSTISGTVDFRAYVYIETAETSSLQVVRLDKFTINGETSVIPEASSMGLFGGVFALAVLLLFRRRS